MILYYPLWLQNLAAYSLQVACVVIVGTLLVRLLRLHVPKIRLAYWQALLAACVFLPLIQPWKPEWVSAGRVRAISRFSIAGQLSPTSASSVASLIAALLLGGFLLRLLRTVLGMQRLRVYCRRAAPLCHENTPIREAQALTGIRPQLYLTSDVLAPAAFGWVSPAVLFPHRFFGLPAPQQKVIACHEFLHVARRDWGWMLAEEFILALLWFHPAIWWVVKNIRLSREQAVDAEVIRLTSARDAYLGALLAIAQARMSGFPVSLFLTESQLAQRVALIAKEVRMSRFRLRISLMVAVGILSLAGVAAIWSFPLRSSLPMPFAGQPAATQPSSSPLADITGNVYKVGKDVQAPHPILTTQPIYTKQARKAHLKGTATFSVVIDAAGNINDIKEISKPLGLGLDESAIRALRGWKFKPGLRKGKPVPVRVVIEITFRLF